MMRTLTRTLAHCALLSLLVFHGSIAAAGPDPAKKCVAAKINASAKRFAAISKCRAKAAVARTAVAPDCLAKAENKFLAAFAKAESQGACTVAGDAATIGDTVRGCNEAIAGDLTGLCGDGVIAPSETCDDGNTTAGDGCSATCAIEAGYACAGTPSACTTICGDGLIRGSEACDDGGASAGDGCSDTCTPEPAWNCGGEPTICTCGVVADFQPAQGLKIPQALQLDATASYSGCGLPLQYFWFCLSDTSIECPNFSVAANANGNTNAAPILNLQEFDIIQIWVTVCVAGTLECAPQIWHVYQGAPVD